MAVYKARQLATIREAIAAGRQALRDQASRDPQVFAQAYIEADGVQIPGEPRSERAPELARRLREALASGVRTVDDRDLQREIDRVHQEVQWLDAQYDDAVVGFLLELPEVAKESPTVEALSHQMEGLGPGVFRKADIIVLQPDCDGARFSPVTEHDLEW
jgi:hypothetical protein